MEKESKNKNKMLVTTLLLVALIFLGVGITYAVILYEGGSENNVMKTGNISMSYTEPSNAYILDNALPIEDNLAIATEHGFEFQVMSNATTNVNDHEGIEIPYEVTMSKMSNGNGIYDLPEDKIKIYVINTDTHEVVLGPTLISQITDISQKDNSKVLFKKTNIHKEGQGSITTSYKLIAWLDKSYVINNNDSKSYQYKFKINVNASSASLDVKDNVAPSINASVEGLNITFNATDATGVTGYAITDTTDVPTNWTTVESTKNLTKTVTVDEYKTYYIHVKDVYNNKSFSKVVVPIPKLKDSILGKNNANVTNRPGELFVSTLTEGNVPTYYFNGAVNNNYVKFGKGQVFDVESKTSSNKDLIWRVVRINEDGSIRLILDDNIGEYAFNTTGGDFKYIYYSNSETNGVMNTLNTWYNNNLLNVDDKIVLGNFCEQMKVTTSTGNQMYIDSSLNGTVVKDNVYEPNFLCSPTYKGKNGLVFNSANVKPKIGLLSIDEIIFAGIPLYTGNQVDNADTYLQKNYHWWTLNSSGYDDFLGNSFNWVVFDSGNIYSGFANNEEPIRPVINLKGDVRAIGDGTIGTPYIIQ